MGQSLSGLRGDSSTKGLLSDSIASGVITPAMSVVELNSAETGDEVPIMVGDEVQCQGRIWHEHIGKSLAQNKVATKAARDRELGYNHRCLKTAKQDGLCLACHKLQEINPVKGPSWHGRWNVCPVDHMWNGSPCVMCLSISSNWNKSLDVLERESPNTIASLPNFGENWEGRIVT